MLLKFAAASTLKSLVIFHINSIQGLNDNTENNIALLSETPKEGVPKWLCDLQFCALFGLAQ